MNTLSNYLAYVICVRKNMRKFLLVIFIALLPVWTYSSILLSDTVSTYKARILDVLSESRQKIAGTDVLGLVQELQIQIVEGDEKGKIIQIKNDYNHFEKDDYVYIIKNTRAEDGFVTYMVSDSYRIPSIMLFLLIFSVLVILIGGKQGIRGIISLLGSFFLIIMVLLPGITHGFSPVLVSIIVSSFIIVFGSYVTHGFNKTTTSAVYGMILTVVVTGILAYIAISYAHLTGFESEEAVYLNFNAKGHIDITGILLGGIMIGLLGVLYDVAIGQAISVEELHTIAPNTSRKKIFKHALRMGREHIGALVNTLAIAYVGASLPLLLLFSSMNTPFGQIINREIFATEIIRTLIGSIGLVLAVPITTLISVLMLVQVQHTDKKDDEEILSHHRHTH